MSVRALFAARGMFVMAEELKRYHDSETRDIGHPAWTELVGIVIALAAVMIGMAVVGTFIQV
jgi:hypothetical protein